MTKFEAFIQTTPTSELFLLGVGCLIIIALSMWLAWFLDIDV